MHTCLKGQHLSGDLSDKRRDIRNGSPVWSLKMPSSPVVGDSMVEGVAEMEPEKGQHHDYVGLLMPS